MPLDFDLWNKQRRIGKAKAIAVTIPLTWALAALTWRVSPYVALSVSLVASALIGWFLGRYFAPKRIPHVGECPACLEIRCRCPN